jgi:lipoate-protein ligase B
VRVLELGLLPYQQGWHLQHDLVSARKEARIEDVLVLLEHTPVITLGRAADPTHVVASSDSLDNAGISIHRVERGGDVTYHGPGQLVGYPILLLASYGLGPAGYMHALEEVLIQSLGEFGLPSQRRDRFVGVWVSGRKIAALGARIDGGVTYHGFALNVDPNLDHYKWIVPCGLEGADVTSMRRELGTGVPMRDVLASVCRQFEIVFGVRLSRSSVDEIGVSLCI